MIDKLIFIVPCYNASQNLEALILSLKEQTDDRWHVIFVDDMSQDDTVIRLRSLTAQHFDTNRYTIFVNEEKKFALRNIVETARRFQDNEFVAIGCLDGDDSLCNRNTVKLVLDEYNETDADIVHTANSWDINGMNSSKPVPNNVNMYSYQWSFSHLKTFRASLLKSISDNNFKDFEGDWFKRAYDQALMLSVAHIGRKRSYVPEVCYKYNIRSCSFPESQRSWSEREQLKTVNIIRARMFIENN